MIDLMLSTVSARPAAQARAGPPAALLGEPFDAGFDAPAAPSSMLEFLVAALDESDRGVLLVSRSALVLHANRAARTALDAAHPLVLHDDELRARRAVDAARLRDALHNAMQRGLRGLLTIGDDDGRVSVSVVPVYAESGGRRPAALLQLGKRNVCEELSVQCYARDHRLTPAEGRVLAALCRGRSPGDIADEFGVALSTVRTQIGSVRAKTGAASIRALVRTVATLPPLMGVLRTPGWRQAS